MSSGGNVRKQTIVRREDGKERPQFSCGERVIYIRRHKGKLVRSVVIVRAILWSMVIDTETGHPVNGWRLTGYNIESGLGGAMSVPPHALLPGNAVDRIVSALEDE
jgi:hypothetical protein